MLALAYGATAHVGNANPLGAQVVNGAASVIQSGNFTTVTNTPGTIINWKSFSIGSGETTRFVQQSVNSAVLNRVVGQDPSKILGTLSSNGKVLLVNPNGVVFGQGAMVDTAGLVLSTLNITDADFISGKMRFVGSAASGDMKIDGVIRSPSGDIYLIAPNIENAAAIKAENGNAILAAGEKVEIIGRGLEGITFEVQNKSNKAVNLGKIEANAVGLFAGTLRQSGIVRANSIGMENGKIVLRAVGDVTLTQGSKTVADATPGKAAGSVTLQSQSGSVVVESGALVSANGSVGGSVNVRALQGDVTVAPGAEISASGIQGGKITLQADLGTNILSGLVRATGTLSLSEPMSAKGGTVQVLGEKVAVSGAAVVDASGDQGGGTVLVGGDWQGNNSLIQNARTTMVGDDALILADALLRGDGGKVVVWAQESTAVMGLLAARGGVDGGNGGNVETSGKQVLFVNRAPLVYSRRNGQAGTWLLDPVTVNIVNGTGTNDANTSYIDVAVINAALDSGTNVAITTNSTAGTGGDINVLAPISRVAGDGAVTLSMTADHDINISANISSANVGAMNVNLSATNRIFIDSGISIFTGGTSARTGLDGHFSALSAAFENKGLIAATGQNGMNAGNIDISANSTLFAGSLQAVGGDASTVALTPGAGGTIMLNNSGAGLLNANDLQAYGGAAINASGVGAGGAGGAVSITANAHIELNGVVNVSGGAGATNLASGEGTAGGIGGTVTIAHSANTSGSGLHINISALISASGGQGGASNGLGFGSDGFYMSGAGGAGGAINVTSLVSGSEIRMGSINIGGGNGGEGRLASGVNLGNRFLAGAGGNAGSINLKADTARLNSNSTWSGDGGRGGEGNGLNTTSGAAFGGAGGAGATMQINTSVEVRADNVTFNLRGGDGGNATGTAGLALGSAGQGGTGGTFKVNTAALNLSANAASPTRIRVMGGAGGSIADATSNASNVSALTGAGGNGGHVDMSVTTASLINLTLEGDGGAGGAAGTHSEYLADSGVGGAGGAGASVSIYSSDQIQVSGVTVGASGGAGGRGANGFGSAGFPGSGGNGGAGGRMSISGGDTQFSLNNFTVLVSGGKGADAGNNFSGVNGRVAAFGGDGGIGGAINISGNLSAHVLNASGLALSSMGGTGGAGGTINPTAGSIASFDVHGGAGGAGGTIGIYNHGDIYIANSTAISIVSAGGAGGAGGLINGSATSTSNATSAGGAGGASNAITINSSAGDIEADAIILASGGLGGNGAAGVFTNAGGSGGIGGAAQQIQLIANGSVKLGHQAQVKSIGGIGGNGGAATINYQVINLGQGAAVFPLAGSAGAGGNGGASGRINISATSASIDIGATLANANPSVTSGLALLKTEGGMAGSGGSFTPAAAQPAGTVGSTVSAGAGGAGGDSANIDVNAASSVLLNSDVTIKGGAGGNGGAALGSTTTAGAGGAGGVSGAYAIVATAGGVSFPGGVTEMSHGIPGANGSQRRVAPTLNISAGSGSINQSASASVTGGNSGGINVSAIATSGAVSMASSLNRISYAEATAGSGDISLRSRVAMSVGSALASTGNIALRVGDEQSSEAALDITGPLTVGADRTITLQSNLLHVTSAVNVNGSAGLVDILSASAARQIDLTGGVVGTDVAGTLSIDSGILNNITASALHIANSAGALSIIGSTAVSLAHVGTLVLSADTINQSAAAPLHVDRLSVHSNNASLLADNTSFNGTVASMVLSGAGSGNDAVLQFRAKAGTTLQVGQNTWGSTTVTGLEKYRDVSLMADHLNIAQPVNMSNYTSPTSVASSLTITPTTSYNTTAGNNIRLNTISSGSAPGLEISQAMLELINSSGLVTIGSSTTNNPIEIGSTINASGLHGTLKLINTNATGVTGSGGVLIKGSLTVGGALEVKANAFDAATYNGAARALIAMDATNAPVLNASGGALTLDSGGDIGSSATPIAIGNIGGAVNVTTRSPTGSIYLGTYSAGAAIQNVNMLSLSGMQTLSLATLTAGLDLTVDNALNVTDERLILSSNGGNVVFTANGSIRAGAAEVYARGGSIIDHNVSSPAITTTVLNGTGAPAIKLAALNDIGSNSAPLVIDYLAGGPNGAVDARLGNMYLLRANGPLSLGDLNLNLSGASVTTPYLIQLSTLVGSDIVIPSNTGTLNFGVSTLELKTGRNIVLNGSGGSVTFSGAELLFNGTTGSAANVSMNGAGSSLNVSGLFTSNIDFNVGTGTTVNLLGATQDISKLVMNGSNVNMSGNATIDTLVLNSGGVNGTGNLDITTGLTQNTAVGLGNTWSNLTVNQASGNLTINRLQATNNLNVTVAGGSLLDGNGAGVANLVAPNVSVRATAVTADTEAAGLGLTATSGAASIANFGALNITGMNVATNLTLANSGGALSQSAPISVAGTTNLSNTAGAITLTNAANNFGGVFTLTNSGTGSVAVATAGNLLLGDVSVGSGTLGLSAAGAGGITQSGSATSLIQSAGAGALTLSASAGPITLQNAGNQLVGPINASAGGAIGLSSSTALAISAVTAGTSAVLSGSQITSTGLITAGGAATLAAGSGAVTLAGALNAGGAVTVTGGVVSINNSLSSGGNVNLMGGTSVALGGVLSGSGATTLSGAVVSINNSLTSVGNVNVSGSTSVTLAAALNTSAAVNLTGGAINLNSSLGAGGAVTVSGTTINVLAPVNAGANLSLSGSGALNVSGNLHAVGTTLLSAAGGVNIGRAVTGGGSITLTGGTIDVNGTGLVNSSAGGVTATGSGITLFGPITSAQAMNVLATSALSVTGALAAGTSMNLSGSSISLASTGSAGTTLGITGGSLAFGNGLTSGGAMTIAATNISGSSSLSKLTSGGSLTLTGGTISLAGTVSSSGATSVNASTSATFNGAVTAGGNLAVQGPTVRAYAPLSGQVVQLAGSSLLDIQSNVSASTLTMSSSVGNIVIGGGDTAYGGSSAAQSSAIDVSSTGTLNLSAGGNIVITGGSSAGASTLVRSIDSATVNAGGNLIITGGSGSGAFAKLDPVLATSTMLITANGVVLQGGSGANAYAAVVSNGILTMTLGATGLQLFAGTGAGSDAVVLAPNGTVSYSCALTDPGCGVLSADPLGNSITETGLFNGVPGSSPLATISEEVNQLIEAPLLQLLQNAFGVPPVDEPSEIDKPKIQGDENVC